VTQRRAKAEVPEDSSSINLELMKNFKTWTKISVSYIGHNKKQKPQKKSGKRSLEYAL